MTKILVVEISENKLVFHHQKPHVIIYNFDPSSPIKVTLSIFFTSKTKSDETVSCIIYFVSHIIFRRERRVNIAVDFAPLLILDFNRSFFIEFFFVILKTVFHFITEKCAGISNAQDTPLLG